jgi:hypothetical protein
MQGKAMTNLAETLCWTSPITAINYAKEAIEINQQVSAPIEVGKAMTAQAIALTASTSSAADAIAIARQADTQQKQNGYRSGVLFALQAQGLAHFVIGNQDETRIVLRQIEALSMEIGGMYAYIPTILTYILSPNSFDFDALGKRFQWLDYTMTAQTMKSIANRFLRMK